MLRRKTTWTFGKVSPYPIAVTMLLVSWSTSSKNPAQSHISEQTNVIFSVLVSEIDPNLKKCGCKGYTNPSQTGSVDHTTGKSVSTWRPPPSIAHSSLARSAWLRGRLSHPRQLCSRRVVYVCGQHRMILSMYLVAPPGVASKNPIRTHRWRNPSERFARNHNGVLSNTAIGKSLVGFDCQGLSSRLVRGSTNLSMYGQWRAAARTNAASVSSVFSLHDLDLMEPRSMGQHRAQQANSLGLRCSSFSA